MHAPRVVRSVFAGAILVASANAWTGCGGAEKGRTGTTDGTPDGGTGDAGGSTSDGATSTIPVDSGLPPGLRLDQATTAQLRQFCDFYVKTTYAPDALEVSCLVDQIGSTDCRRRTDVCIDKIQVELRSGITLDSCVEQLGLGCVSTVSEAEDCALSSLHDFARAATLLSCDTTGDPYQVIADAGLLGSTCEPGPCPVPLQGDACCVPSDPCRYANDGYCDCTDQTWDATDCSATPQCCAADDPCHYADDGYCDCIDQTWDAVDCSIGTGCCAAGDPCQYANDGYCDCMDQAWDTLDCQGPAACCDPRNPCGWSDDGFCDCPAERWDLNDCSPCCTAANACGWDHDGFCDCPNQPWEAPDCAPADGGVTDAGNPGTPDASPDSGADGGDSGG